MKEKGKVYTNEIAVCPRFQVDTGWILQAVTIMLAFAVTIDIDASDCRAESDESAVISRIDAGSIVTPTGLDGWSNVVLVATPKVTSGEIDKVSQIVMRYAAMLTTVIAADAQKIDGQYQLQRIGLGLAAADGENFRVVSSRGGNAGFGMIGARVLEAAEKSLDRVTVALHHPMAKIIDSPAIVFVGNQHQEVVARHLIWVQPKTGVISSAVWLIGGDDRSAVLKDHGVLLPANFRETRHLHVDVSEFVLGIPGAKAFAMEGLPPGKLFPIVGPQARAASATPPTIDDLAVIAAHLTVVAK